VRAGVVASIALSRHSQGPQPPTVGAAPAQSWRAQAPQRVSNIDQSSRVGADRVSFREDVQGVRYDDSHSLAH
jgi:hypothetical protein